MIPLKYEISGKLINIVAYNPLVDFLQIFYIADDNNLYQYQPNKNIDFVKDMLEVLNEHDFEYGGLPTVEVDSSTFGELIYRHNERMVIKLADGILIDRDYNNEFVINYVNANIDFIDKL